ncbi:PAS domain S-box protein [Candidatus Bipolaricaulota bacterium]
MATESGHLSESRISLFKVFEQSDDFVLLLDMQGKILQANRIFLETFAVAPDGLINLSILHFDSGFPVTEILLHRRIQAMLSNPGTEPIPVDVSVTPLDSFDPAVALLIARRNTRAVQIMGSIVGGLPGRFGVIDRNLQLIRWSEYRTYEPARSVAHLPSRDLRQLLPKPLQAEAFKAIEEAFENGRSSREYKHGEDPISGALISFTRIEIDKTPYVVMFSVDIADRLRVEKALHESEARFRSIVEQSEDGIVLIGHDGLIAEWNEGQERLTGILRKDVIGKASWDVRVKSTPSEQQTEDLTQRYERSIRRALELGQAPWIEETMEWELELPNGDRCHVETVSFPIQVEEQRMLGSISRDITTSKQQERTLLDYAERLKALAERLAEAQEDERVRCSAELHDQVGQGLTAIDLTLTASLRHLANHGEEAEHYIEQALEITRDTAARTRNLMSEMRPLDLDEYGLEAALRWYAEHLNMQTDTRVAFRTDEGIPRLSRNTETSLFRIAQEALNNALKHSKAERVQVSLKLNHDHLEMAIQDNGQGFAVLPKAQDKNRGWGLMIMDERATAAGGRLVVDSRPGHGTKVLATVSCP